VIPVILDTDLGTDIDDHWAVAHLLASRELDVKLITTGTGDTEHRAELLSGMLRAAGRTEVPIGIGPSTPLPFGFPLHVLRESAAKYPLGDHPGSVKRDGTQAIIDTIRSSATRVTIVAIGPVTNLAAAVERDPSITRNSRVIAMAGWLRDLEPEHACGPSSGPRPEYNVVADIDAFRRIVATDWEITLVPIDTCGDIVLDGLRYQRILGSDSAVLATVLEGYEEWCRSWPRLEDRSIVKTRSTVLFDTLPVFLAYREDLVEFDDILITVPETGVVAESASGRRVRAALRWSDKDAFLDHLVDRLLDVRDPAVESTK
jgi:inosine-uridine nucleoside N-ribohydrolase